MKPIIYLRDQIGSGEILQLNKDWSWSGESHFDGKSIPFEISGQPMAYVDVDKRVRKAPKTPFWPPVIELCSYSASPSPGREANVVCTARSVEDLPNGPLKNACIKVQAEEERLMTALAKKGCDTIVSFYRIGGGMPALIVSEGPHVKSLAYCYLTIAGWRRKKS